MNEDQTCPSCHELVPLRASVCPHCQGDLAVDVVLEGGDIGPRDRYELARALASLGPPLPAAAVINRLLAERPGVVLRRADAGFARTVQAMLAEYALVAAVVPSTAVPGPGEQPPGSAQGPPWARLQVLATKRVAVAVASLAVLALLAGLGDWRSSDDRQTAAAPPEAGARPPAEEGVQPSPAPTAPAQDRPPGRARPRIVSLIPSSITLVRNRLPGGSLAVQYEIENPEGVEKATATLYLPGFNERLYRLAREAADDSSDQDWSGMTPPEPLDVPVQASGTVFLSLDAPDFDLSYARASYLEVKLKLRGPGLAVVAIERLPFTR